MVFKICFLVCAYCLEVKAFARHLQKGRVTKSTKAPKAPRAKKGADNGTQAGSSKNEKEEGSGKLKVAIGKKSTNANLKRKKRHIFSSEITDSDAVDISAFLSDESRDADSAIAPAAAASVAPGRSVAAKRAASKELSYHYHYYYSCVPDVNQAILQW